MAVSTLLLSTRLAAADPERSGGWSAELLNQILKAEPPKPAVPPPEPAAPEVVLRTYRLVNLHVGEAGKAQNVIAILGKLLPPGSTVNTDVAANSLHVLTTTAAHAAAWDYLSAVDVADAGVARTPEIPDEVRSALKKLSDNSAASGQLLNTLGTLKSEVSTQLAEIDARQHRQLLQLAVAGTGLVALLILAFWLTMRRRPAAPSAPTEAITAVMPDQLASALVPVQEKMRGDMLGLLNEVAIKLQAQHEEQQQLVVAQQRQLEGAREALAEERRQFINEAGTMVVQAVERVDATTAKLVRQQDKVAELVQELQDTVRELDETKDSLRGREVELERERAKIAALSLLLEEGSPLPPLAANGHAFPPLHAPSGNGTASEFSPPASFSCTTTDPIPSTPARAALNPSEAPSPRRFLFLPPEHPET
jgi:hypothetical protein